MADDDVSRLSLVWLDVEEFLPMFLSQSNTGLSNTLSWRFIVLSDQYVDCAALSEIMVYPSEKSCSNRKWQGENVASDVLAAVVAILL